MSQEKKYSKKRVWLIFLMGAIVGVVAVLCGNKAMYLTGTEEFCASCHVHPHAFDSWKKSTHVNNKAGVKVQCIDCHLPPKGNFYYFREKARTGLYDLWSYWTKDHASINWEAKKQLEHAVKITYNESCKRCHTNLFPRGLSDDGGTAHLYYEANEKKLNLQCISCHLDVGHYNPNYKHSRMMGIPVILSANAEKFTEAAVVTQFENFTEQIPGTAVSFEMIAIPGGTFKMGSPPKEKFRRDDEGPVREVTVSRFFMSETQISWDEYWTFHFETSSEGRIPPEVMKERNRNALTVDAISGPTPPFGDPTQGWGAGARPAITMMHYSAEIYCQWLSQKTGKKYRLPTEAEWEYAARGGTETPYFFPGNPKKFSSQGWWNSMFGADTTIINRYAIYELNSNMKTHEPSRVHKNPFGLKNMLGNVLEYCSDWYAPDAYSQTPLSVSNPTGPEQGTERVLRGGNYASDAAHLRVAARFATKTEEWLKTDPQQPKSIWWYTDIKGIGFRVVCEPDSLIK